MSRDAPAPTLYLAIMHLRGLCDSHREVPGFYWACGRYDQRAPWGGARLEVSRDDGDSWAVVDQTSEECFFGVCENAPMPMFGHDATSELRIHMNRGALESVGERGVRERRWIGWLGGEVIYAQRSTPAGGGLYIVSELSRGKAGTDFAVQLHGKGAEFVLLTGPGIHFVRVDIEDLGRPMLARAVPVSGAAELADQKSLLVSGLNVDLKMASESVGDAVREMSAALGGR